jgi:hypothetical protein
VEDGASSKGEEQQRLLHEARAKRDAFMEERARVENQLNSALEMVKIYQALLAATKSHICKAEDLIGDIRIRLRDRGFHVTLVTPASPPPASSTAPSPSPATDEKVGESSPE